MKRFAHMKVLIIEDDPILSKNICEALTSENLVVEPVYDGLLAEKILKKYNFDCIVLDINLPGKNGYDLCKNFRNYNSDTPVLMLTAFGELEDKIQGFDCGADDYLTKPFYMRELILRVNSLIRRKKHSHLGDVNEAILVADDITLNDAQKKVFRQGKEINLTPREYQILFKLMGKNGEIVSKADLIKEIWGSSFDANTNTIEVYINFLRNKLDKPFSKNTIKTKVGYGYYLDIGY
ncbi:MAG TPA: response regulator transcription factor [Lunatimonas sp.]|nr:response regulator transcription factor [Lunatimonas sp.]